MRWHCAVLLALAAGSVTLASAGTLAAAVRQTSTDYCSRESTRTAAQQDQVLRLVEVARRELEASGRPLAIVARSGLDLRRFGQRYSHAGIALAEGTDLRWSVRQLYYACDEKRPRLFDQGLAGFLMGTDDPEVGYASLLLLPEGPELEALRVAATDESLGLALLAERYSANAYPFSTRYQNCNQWLAELLGVAWTSDRAHPASRTAAQAGLRSLGYMPTVFAIESVWLMALGQWVPLIHLDDHPEETLQSMKVRVSMPSSIEAFVRRQLPGAERVELCHAGGRIVVRRGWSPLPDGCVPEPGDRVIDLD